MSVGWGLVGYFYTAGGQGADLSIPGLPAQTAEELKEKLTQKVRQETLLSEAITEVGAEHDG